MQRSGTETARVNNTICRIAVRYCIYCRRGRLPRVLLGCEMLAKQTRGRMVICGNSNLVIRQMWGEIDCKSPGLQLLRLKALDQLRSWPTHEFLHVKCNWNQSADRLASTALQLEKSMVMLND